ncbi:ABC transporter ATP-binding protein [Anaerococcus tetradius]|uniref:ABC transporter, ATP-binding protein n=2 Tax=Anaerococcus tetradius TaxID=33036 RepID=C2CIK9_9FIRM|nr:ABC transporter ATP-binding protein [Anaerococcus tetradius]EEI82605.1 ABC transporter, ATP-binding protein [Anaerococcus tetradius ATCC 35098]KWZ76740.1 ABC transporter, ATP-binding protein [Anaerococcus tetradius]
MSLIEIRGLKKYYKLGGNVIKALDGIDLDIEKGEFVALLGTSGSGKSTLLNMLAGLERPTKGTIKYGNISLTDLNEEQITKFRNLNIGFVFQSYNLLPYLSAWENVSLPLTFKGLNKEDRKKEAYKILKQVGLADRMDNRPNELSGGQQQRVSIARAFVGRPKIIFADEPTGNLDTKTSFEVMKLIKNITRENKQTFIMVTHDDEMTEFADKVLFMRDGHLDKIHEKLTIDEVLENDG